MANVPVGMVDNICKNVKSRKHSDLQCPYITLKDKEYCSRHIKNPRPFGKLKEARIYTRRERVAADKIYMAWHKYISRLRFRQQGPIANCIDLANNETEIFTLEPVTTIPPIYRFTYRDEKHMFWGFDIRTIQQYTGKGAILKNAYTCEALPEAVVAKIRSRIKYLIGKKCPLIHTEIKTLSSEQIWNQNVLDIFLKIEELGYLVNSDWFHEMTIMKHRAFYRKIYMLWNSSLQLSQKQKEAIIPGYKTKEFNPFLLNIDDTALMTKAIKWWRKKNLHLINLFITKAKEKENRSLGALYCLMGFVSVCPGAASAFPWLVDSIP